MRIMPKRVITMWRRNCFLLSKVTNGNNYNILEGEWRLGEVVQIVLVNMYNSGALLEKELFERRFVRGER